MTIEDNQLVPERARNIKANYDWTKYDSSEIWAWLPDSTPTMRRQLVNSGALSYARKKKAVSNNVFGNIERG